MRAKYCPQPLNMNVSPGKWERKTGVLQGTPPKSHFPAKQKRLRFQFKLRTAFHRHHPYRADSSPHLIGQSVIHDTFLLSLCSRPKATPSVTYKNVTIPPPLCQCLCSRQPALQRRETAPAGRRKPRELRRTDSRKSGPRPPKCQSAKRRESHARARKPEQTIS